ncbi:MAG: hypothetical protein HYU35_01475 [Parcubacteria group bacterium]|nr:hypothetical protein [Parcubacteria group bacterium]
MEERHEIQEQESEERGEREKVLWSLSHAPRMTMVYSGVGKQKSWRCSNHSCRKRFKPDQEIIVVRTFRSRKPQDPSDRSYRYCSEACRLIRESLLQQELGLFDTPPEEYSARTDHVSSDECDFGIGTDQQEQPEDSF